MTLTYVVESERMRRALAALLVAVLTSSAVAPVTCAGWEPTASERMACCQRAAHDCPDQFAADACCAQQEQTHQPAMTLSPSAISAPTHLGVAIISAPDLFTLDKAGSRHHGAFAVPHLHAPPGSFEPPLRI